MSRLLRKINLAQANGSLPKFLDSLAEAHLLIIDDWLRSLLSKAQTNDVLEMIDDRYKRSSTILATQIPVAEWLERMADPTLSDAVMDRIVHNAYRLEPRGESMRKTKSMLTHAGHPELK